MKLIFRLLLVALLGAGPAHAKDAPDKLLAMLPATIGAYLGEEVVSYDYPELGASRPYRNVEGTVVTVYLYDLGVAEIARGTGSEIVREAFDMAQQDIKESVQAGYYKDVWTSAPETVVVDYGQNESLALLSAQYVLELPARHGKGPRQVHSVLYVTGARGHILKMRISQPHDDAGLSADVAGLVQVVLQQLGAGG